jgi:predicted metal-dependent phosphoesterase TrpH
VSRRHQRAPEPTDRATPATADLHTHTARSDGVLEPVELVRQAAAVGVRLLAIADHDSLAAYRELRHAPPGRLPAPLELIPAVEINAVTDGLGVDSSEGELHVLGLGVDPDDPGFEALLARQRGARRERFLATVDRLRELDLSIDDPVAELDLERDDALGRPTIARALMATGQATSVEDAFARIIGRGRPGYVPRRGVGPVEAITAIRAVGGLASLAHFGEAPAQLDLLRSLRDAGLNGLETHHGSFGEETRTALATVARDLGLVETGGTDYHGDLGPYAAAHAALVLPDAIADRVRATIDQRRIARL